MSMSVSDPELGVVFVPIVQMRKQGRSGKTHGLLFEFILCFPVVDLAFPAGTPREQ